MSPRARRQDQLVFAPIGIVDLGAVGRGGSGSHYLGIDGQEYIGKCPALQGEEMLAADDIEAVYSAQLPTHYGELLGQQKLPRGS
jgi:hypothetical protein